MEEVVNNPSSGCTAKPCTGLVLPGGGARGAYQVGVLRALADIWSGCGGTGSPFPVISGSSAGAINAAVLASHADSIAEAAIRLDRFWKSLHCSTIYRTDSWTILTTSLRWMLSFSPIISGFVSQPRSLLDNRPLYEFLSRELLFGRIKECIDAGALKGVAITASGYTCASAISFFQAREGIEPWSRARRHGRASRLRTEHLMGSAALPFLFPAYRIGSEYFGDGGMRMVAPLSPAIHLGADRLLVITTRDEKPDPEPTEIPEYPSIGEVGGYLLDTIFMDRLTADLARLERINKTLRLMSPEQYDQTPLNIINSLVIRPSVDLRDLTRKHARDIPRPVRLLLRTLGGWGRDWRMASYLLFEPGYATELIDLGYQDGMAKSDEVRAFLEEPVAETRKI
ncbi:MAG TPA: patatin-like phospholipase family protein [Xanthomonadales bacterium]|nr:patatin-like phospholipase family protein [Xanthomonadales bacterium]